MAGAVAAMERMGQASLHPTVSASYRTRHVAGRVMFAIRQNDLEAATNWGRHLSEYTDILHLEFQHVPARLLIAQGKKEAAAELLRDLYQRLVQVDAHGLAIGVRVCQALAPETEESALEFLAEALIKGEPAGYIRTFVDEGTLLAPLLRLAISQGIMPDYASKLLIIIEAEARKRKKARSGGTLLSERELEILRLLAAEVSNQQIADSLTISLSTVKTHVHHILEKLNVKDRSQAVYYARELNLI